MPFGSTPEKLVTNPQVPPSAPHGTRQPSRCRTREQVPAAPQGILLTTEALEPRGRGKFLSASAAREAATPSASTESQLSPKPVTWPQEKTTKK